MSSGRCPGPAMDLTIALLHLSAHLVLAFALVLPRLRRIAISALTAVAAATLLTGTDDGARRLETVHHYAGFAGNDMEVSMVPFPTGTFEASGGQWPIPYAGWTLLWILVLWASRRRALHNSWLLPMLFAWSSFATWLAMQWLAAPSVVVQPVGLDRFLWPAGLALCVLSARRAKGPLTLFVLISGGILVMRLPIALWSYIASTEHLGTCLDVHTVVDIVNPMTQVQFEPRLEPGSASQFFWLIWLQHVIIFPAVYLMSLFGIGFGVFMFHKHEQMARRQAPRAD